MTTLGRFARFLLLATFVLSFAVPASATHQQQGDHFILSTTPTQFSTTLGMVQSITFYNVPGYCGKVYIGNSTLNVSTGVGIIKVIYPNCSGDTPDHYTLEDRTATDGIDSSTFYIAGGTASEQITWEAYKTNITASSVLRIYNYSSTPCIGLVDPDIYNHYSPSAPLCATASNAPQTNVAVIQVAVLPGYSGKVLVGHTSMNPSTLSHARRVMYPNTSGTITEFYASYSPDGSNSLYLPAYTHSSTGAGWGESPIVTAWQRQ